MRFPSLRHPRQFDNRAVAAVEFAMCAPFLLFLFVGTLEILLLYRTSAKLNALTANFAEMVSLQPTSPISTGVPGLSDLCKGAIQGLQPFPPTGLTIDVASVTQTSNAIPATQTSKAVPATYGEWETDLNSSCSPTGTTNIGTTGATGAVTIATGSGVPANAMVQTAGDNVIIVRATLTYPGILGIVLNSVPTLSQSAVARWRWALPTNINTTAAPAPAPPGLELLCSSASTNACVLATCSSSTVCS
jgi:Flp pilus assembly protein TadG